MFFFLRGGSLNAGTAQRPNSLPPFNLLELRLHARLK